MSRKRDWRQYGRRLKGHLLGAAGGVSAAGATLAGIGGGLATVGLIAATGPVAIAVTVGGGVVSVGALLTASVLSIPPRKPTAADSNTSRISIAEVADFHPPVLKLGVIGNRQAGKTTLIKHIL